MRVHVIPSLLIAALAFTAITSASPPGWSTQFVDAGFVIGTFDQGPLCLQPFPTVDGPRLFVGGDFAAIRTPGTMGGGSASYRGVAVWDGAHWSGVQGGGVPSSTGDQNVLAITIFPVAGVNRVILAGSFEAPGTNVGIGYLDDARALHPLIPGPVPSAWFGGAYAWTPPSPPPPAPAATPEIIVTSGIFPNGSEYGYRYTPSAVLSLPPGLVTVTNAFAEFDDGTGRALYIGVPMAGAEPSFTLTKWNGVTCTPINPGPMSWVTAVCVHDDGSGAGPALYAAGQGFRRYRAGVWEAVSGPGAPTFNINALASFDDGSGPALYAAGQFTTNVPTPTGTTPAVNIVRLRNGVWEALGSGLTGGAPKAMAVFDEDGPGPQPPGLFIVGNFTTAGGVGSVGIARWGVPVCRADYNGLNGLEVADIFDFINDWFGGSPRADFNGGGLSIQDIFDFINVWLAGC